MPYYNYTDFKKACSEDKGNVVIINPAPKDAANDFNLKTNSRILDFISNGEPEDLKFINTKEWENNPNKTNLMYVDAYEFRSLNKLGYLAFMYNETGKKWIIKSFHLSSNRSLSMQIALEKAGLLDGD